MSKGEVKTIYINIIVIPCDTLSPQVSRGAFYQLSSWQLHPLLYVGVITQSYFNFQVGLTSSFNK